MISFPRNFYSILAWDLKLQLRYYFWIAGLVITLVWLAILSILPPEVSVIWVPVLLFVDTCAIGIIFIGGMLYLEKRQGTIEAIAVMPVSTTTWLLSKVVSLSILCSACALSIIFFKADSVNWYRAVPAIVLSSTLYTSLGFILACPFKNLMNYFLAMALAITVLNIPVFGYLNVLDSVLLWLVPTQPVMHVLSGIFNEMTTASFSLAMLVLLCWTYLSFRLCIKAFYRFVSQRMEN